MCIQKIVVDILTNLNSTISFSGMYEKVQMKYVYDILGKKEKVRWEELGISFSSTYLVCS